MNEKHTGGMLRLFEILREAMVSRRAVRFYEDQGLLSPAGRDRHGRRVYVRSDLMRLQLIRLLRSAGLSIAAVRDVLDSRVARPEDRGPAEWLQRMEQVLSHYSDEVGQQLQTLQQADGDLRSAVAWLNAHRDEVLRDPGRFTQRDDVPVIVRALLSQPSTLVAIRPPRATRAKNRASSLDGLGFSPPTW